MPPGVPQAWTPEQAKPSWGRGWEGAAQEVETFSKSLGKVVRGCTRLLTQLQL